MVRAAWVGSRAACVVMACVSRKARWMGLDMKMPCAPLALESLATIRGYCSSNEETGRMSAVVMRLAIARRSENVCEKPFPTRPGAPG